MEDIDGYLQEKGKEDFLKRRNSDQDAFLLWAIFLNI